MALLPPYRILRGWLPSSSTVRLVVRTVPLRRCEPDVKHVLGGVGVRVAAHYPTPPTLPHPPTHRSHLLHTPYPTLYLDPYSTLTPSFVGWCILPFCATFWILDCTAHLHTLRPRALPHTTFCMYPQPPLLPPTFARLRCLRGAFQAFRDIAFICYRCHYLCAHRDIIPRYPTCHTHTYISSLFFAG